MASQQGIQFLDWAGRRVAFDVRGDGPFLVVPAWWVSHLEADLLSERERQVLALVARGLTDQEIAEQLVLSRHTVHRHVANVRRKLGRTSRSAAVAEAARLGLL